MKLPGIVAENGHVWFICPVCNGGTIDSTRTETNGATSTTVTRKIACDHCFGFARLPVPSWYREQGGERC